MWVLLELPQFRGATHANGFDNWSRYREVGLSGSRILCCQLVILGFKTKERCYAILPISLCHVLSPLGGGQAMRGAQGPVEPVPSEPCNMSPSVSVEPFWPVKNRAPKKRRSVLLPSQRLNRPVKG